MSEGKQDDGRVLADQALVSDQAPSGLAATRFDPSRAIGFTGTQHRWTPEQTGRLRSVLAAVHISGAEWMCNGDCLGSDARAAKLWEGFGGRIRLYPPDNPRKRAFIFASETQPEAPYLERNRHIAQDCAALIATPKEDFEELRSGTWATIRHARKLVRPIVIVWPTLAPTTENWPGSWGSVFRDRDGNPEGGDGVAGSVHDGPARRDRPETPTTTPQIEP